MNEELLALIESINAMEDQGERSMALSSVREQFQNMVSMMDSLSDENANLTASNESLKAHNQKLFLSVGGDTKEPTPDFDGDPEEVFSDESLFE